jgi:polyvinyl alcohol dehydrogenase (cytochrome)
MNLALFLAFSLSAGALFAAPSGEDVYKARCAGCHDQSSDRVPPKTALQKLPSSRIVRALDSGAMMAIAFRMNREDRVSVASYLGTNDEAGGPPPSSFCSERTVKLTANPAGWNGWSAGTTNARFQSADRAGLSVDGVKNLKLKWAFGFDGDVTAFAAPTVLDGYLFVGSASGMIHAMNANSGCLEWVYQANGPVRSAITVAPLKGGKQTLMFGDMTGWFYSLDSQSGKLLWKVHIEEHDSTRLTAGSLAYNDVVYVPVASWEETRASDAGYPCCTFRGSVVALNIADGKQLWKTWMVGEPHEIGKNPRGEPMMGPSGVGVWSAPTLDEKRGLLYVNTGDNYSKPATELSDSVVALDLKSGKIAWSKQLTEGDAYSGACGRNQEKCGPDYDFGSSAVLVTTTGGNSLLLAGQKSGVVTALDPEKKGDIVWQTRVGIGGTNGGVQWGMSSDGEFVYASVSDLVRARNPVAMSSNPTVADPSKGGGITALRVADGRKIWHADAKPCASDAPAGCSPSQPGALTAIPGAVFSGSMDGHMRAFGTENGNILWDFDTARDFVTVNGIKAHGGSLDGPGAVVVKGMVFINSGYPRNGGMPGNVLLAFTAQ